MQLKSIVYKMEDYKKDMWNVLVTYWQKITNLGFTQDLLRQPRK